MKTSFKKLPKSKIELLIELSGQEIADYLKKTLKDLSEDLEIKGFRKGKAPEEIVRKNLGEEKILTESLDIAIKKSYLKAIIENKIEPISQPEIEIIKAPSLESLFSGLKKKFSIPLIFQAKIQILPVIDLPKYQEIASKAKKGKVDVEEKEIQNALSWLQKSRAKRSQISRPAQKDDFVEIEFSSSQIKTAEPQQDAFILGQGKLIPGFEENLVGMEAEQEKEFFLTFPEKHIQKELAGRKIKFRVKMKSVQQIELSKIDDQFAQELGKFKDLQSLKQNIKAGLLKEKKIAESQRIRIAILEKIIESSNFEVPDVLIEKEAERIFQEFKQNVENQSGMFFPDYLKKIEKSENDLKESFKEPAEKRAKSFLVLRKIAQQEKIEASEEEVKAKLNEFLKASQKFKKTGKKIDSLVENKKQTTNEEGWITDDNLDLERLKEYYRESIRNEKTLSYLEGLAN